VQKCVAQVEFKPDFDPFLLSPEDLSRMDQQQREGEGTKLTKEKKERDPEKKKKKKKKEKKDRVQQEDKEEKQEEDSKGEAKKETQDDNTKPEPKYGEGSDSKGEQGEQRTVEKPAKDLRDHGFMEAGNGDGLGVQDPQPPPCNAIQQVTQEHVKVTAKEGSVASSEAGEAMSSVADPHGLSKMVEATTLKEETTPQSRDNLSPEAEVPFIGQAQKELADPGLAYLGSLDHQGNVSSSEDNEEGALSFQGVTEQIDSRIDGIYRYMQRGLVYPAPFAVFLTF
jgi:hypothetical protein